MDENENNILSSEDILKKIGQDDKKDIRTSEDKKDDRMTRDRHGKTRKNRKKKKKKLIIAIIILVAILLVASTGLGFFNMLNSNIVKGVSVGNVDVSKLSVSEAKNKLESLVSTNRSKEISISCDGVSEITSLELLEVNYDIGKVVSEAIDCGRKDNIFKNNFESIEALVNGKKYDVDYTLSQEKLDVLYNSLISKMEGRVEEYSYSIEDDELIITKGKDGKTINKEMFETKIKEMLSNFANDTSSIELTSEFKTADAINIDKIYEEVHREPKDAYIVDEPFQVFNSENGIDFNVEEAKQIIAEPKEEYIVPLSIKKANVQILDLGDKLFNKRLGTYTTYYDPSNSNRSTNIYLSAKKINGTVVMPGETFSYNRTVGKRTIAAGFKEAGAYANGKVVQEVGGGICQVSSTLYNACLYANLEIVQRYNHLFECSYIDAGRDATVSWGGPDFVFKNSRKYPVKIAASGSSGTVTVSIYGLEEEEEYTVKVTSSKTSYIEKDIEYIDDPTLEIGKEVVEQSGHGGCTSEAYKILYKGGQEYSRTLLSKDRYSALKSIIRRGTKPAEAPAPTPTPPKEEPKQETPSENQNTVTNTTEQNNNVANTNQTETTNETQSSNVTEGTTNEIVDGN